MAPYGFRGLGWLLCSLAVAIGSYFVTSQGAAERGRLDQIEASIIAAKKEIRGLETEFNTRANMVQLGEWNGNFLKLAAPATAQYLPDEQALASMDQPQAPAEAAKPAEKLAQVVPSGTPKALTDAIAKVDARTASAAPRDGTAKVARVAMLDDSMLADLKKTAQNEQLAFR